MTEFVSAVPIIPARDMEDAASWYRDELGFDVFHTEREYGIVGRGESWIHFWGPSEIAPEDSNTMIRLGVQGIDELYAHCQERDIVHPNAPLQDTAVGVPRVLRARPGRESRHLLRAACRPRPARRLVIRLGRISYVNMAPVFHGLEADVEEVTGVPTELNRMLLDGELDIAPIPSIEYARNADRLRILPRMCVSSEGAVESIQLVTRGPFGQVRSVAVTPESATSVVLTRILLPKAEILPLGVEADATLLIGDAALRSAFEDPTPHYDLGRLWLEKTGLPMVFAVWAAPEPVAEGLIELEHSLVASVRLARSEPERLARQASETYGYPPGFLARYFEKLRYSFGPRERAGLYTFLEMARDVGELEHVPELRFVREEVVPA